MVNVLLCCTGSVASIKVPILIQHLFETRENNVSIIATKHSLKFFNPKEIPAIVKIYTDENEWSTWKERGDPILHIDLGKWADILVIAPLDANTLAKIATGLCDNLLTSTVRAWELVKPLIFCPAMNTKMYNHPLTKEQIDKLLSWGYHMVPVIEKTLVCGDTGIGAMAEVNTIISKIKEIVKN